MFGPTTMEFAAELRPKAIGRTIRKNPATAASIAPFSARNRSGPLASAASMTAPRSRAVNTSAVPAMAEMAKAAPRTGSAPRSAQPKNAHSARGGGPSARANASMNVSGLMARPPVPVRGDYRRDAAGWRGAPDADREGLGGRAPGRRKPFRADGGALPIQHRPAFPCPIPTVIYHDRWYERSRQDFLENPVFAEFSGKLCRLPPHNRWADRQAVRHHHRIKTPTLGGIGTPIPRCATPSLRNLDGRDASVGRLPRSRVRCAEPTGRNGRRITAPPPKAGGRAVHLLLPRLAMKSYQTGL
jgi:hypothetical protein